VVLPYALWQLFRESGYPWWIQVLAALALLAGFTYLFRQGTFGRSRRRQAYAARRSGRPGKGTFVS
jgi:hypothetical protein